MKKSTLLTLVLSGSLIATLGLSACKTYGTSGSSRDKLLFIHSEPMGENYESLAYVFTAEEIKYRNGKVLNPKTILKDLGPDGDVDEIIEETKSGMHEYTKGQAGTEERFEKANRILQDYSNGNFESIYKELGGDNNL